MPLTVHVSRPAPRLMMEPHVTDGAGISEKRLQEIRNRIKSSYEALFSGADNDELKELNKRMSREISDQIEKRLKELAEQVEIPL